MLTQPRLEAGHPRPQPPELIRLPGALAALDRVELRSPIVLRLDGTNSVEARSILQERGSDQIIPELTMVGAARRAVEIAGANS